VTLDRAFLVALLAGGVVGGVALAVGGALFIPLAYGPVSVGDAVALLGLGPFCHSVGRSARSTLAGTVPAVAWLVVTMAFATRRAEGDLVVGGDVFGIMFLLLGTLSAAVGIGTIRAGMDRDVRPNGSSEAANRR